MIPAISLAYEKPETDIMNRKPRNAKTDHLVNAKLISFAYFQIGMIQALAGFFSFFVVMDWGGYTPSDLVGLGAEFSPTDGAWNEPSRREGMSKEELLKHAQTAFFVSIVIVQWADLMICKTRKLSLFQQGMRNWILNFGLFSETALAAILLYVPAFNGLGTRPILFTHWLCGLPFSLLIFTYDEIRKAIIRRYPGGWLDRNTSY